MRIASEGLRWLAGSLDGADAEELANALNLTDIYRAQNGLLADSDLVARSFDQRAAGEKVNV